MVAAQYEVVPAERFFPVLRATEKLWPKLRPQLTCPLATCAHPAVVCHDNTEARVWRHLDAFGKRTGLLCSPPRARYGTCRHVWRASDPLAAGGGTAKRPWSAAEFFPPVGAPGVERRTRRTAAKVPAGPKWRDP